MKTVRIPTPGILLGSYPERRLPEVPSVLSRWIARAQHVNLGAQQRHQRAFITAVRELLQTLATESAQRFGERLITLRAQLARDGLAEPSLIEAFAVVALTCQRELGVSPYDTQLLAARIMLNNHLAEMATGEGKTLAAAITASTAALAGIPVHVVTANDYLVARDATHLRPLYQALGLAVGAVTQPMVSAERQRAYACDITYCTAKELVFDYLRDGVAVPRASALEQRARAFHDANSQKPKRLLRGLCMAIIDEADSILIDEARVPLVLSQVVADTTLQALQAAWDLSGALEPTTHFHRDTQSRSTQLTHLGREHLRTVATVNAYRWLNTRHCEDTVTLALTARHMLERGRDFVVEDGRVHIVDATTGRKAQGRSWANGLHQLVEIKEHCAPTPRVVTLAQITYQRFFPRYFRLCGMSGTLTEARGELHQVYNLQVCTVPLHRASRRTLLPAQVFAHAHDQWQAVARSVRELHTQGRPVLIGTDAVLDSEALSLELAKAQLPHALLNASQDQREAEIIAAAGAPGAITVATNMAGRGTDILLPAASVVAGGLHVICCQQNSARRIDRQLIGRCARQGDPGSAVFFINLQGPLLSRSRFYVNAINYLKINKLDNFSTLAKQALTQAQRATERRHQKERAALMQQDQRVNDWFAFSGTEQ